MKLFRCQHVQLLLMAATKAGKAMTDKEEGRDDNDHAD